MKVAERYRGVCRIIFGFFIKTRIAFLYTLYRLNSEDRLSIIFNYL